MEIDKRFINYIAEKVCEHNYTKLINDLTNLDYSNNIKKCSYCNLPHDKKRCITCRMSWCEREYYCKKPTNYKGIDGKCCPEYPVCIGCFYKCYIEGCNTSACAILKENLCKVFRCYNCKKTVCKEHAPQFVIKYNHGEPSYYNCINCIK